MRHGGATRHCERRLGTACPSLAHTLTRHATFLVLEIIGRLPSMAGGRLTSAFALSEHSRRVRFRQAVSLSVIVPDEGKAVLFIRVRVGTVGGDPCLRGHQLGSSMPDERRTGSTNRSRSRTRALTLARPRSSSAACVPQRSVLTIVLRGPPGQLCRRGNLARVSSARAQQSAGRTGRARRHCSLVSRRWAG